MTLSRDEAASALSDISKTEQRSWKLFGYRNGGAPHLFLWGAIWMIAYSASYFRPHWTLVWPVLAVVGSIGSFWFGWRVKGGRTGAFSWRFGGTFLAVLLFIGALFAILPPHTDAQVAAFFPILVALFYLLIGVWMEGPRMIVLGLAIGALTLFGFFDLAPYFALWMAVVGGGGMILGGFWLRSA
jgi:hypothetical protein